MAELADFRDGDKQTMKLTAMSSGKRLANLAHAGSAM
jgi:hypothetical protein